MRSVASEALARNLCAWCLTIVKQADAELSFKTVMKALQAHVPSVARQDSIIQSVNSVRYGAGSH